MKATAKKELMAKTIEELLKDLRDLKAEIAKMSIEMTSGKIKNTNAIKDKKKIVARILTYLSQKKEAEEVKVSV